MHTSQASTVVVSLEGGCTLLDSGVEKTSQKTRLSETERLNFYIAGEGEIIGKCPRKGSFKLLCGAILLGV